MSKKVGRSFWWLWLIANVIGNMLLSSFVWEDPYDLRSRIFLNEILHGVGISVAQALVLRDRFAKEGWWLPLTLWGWIIGLAIVFFLPTLSLRSQSQNLPSLSILVIDFAIIGTIVGICQWQLLKSFRDGGIWLLASPISLSMSTLGLYLGYMAKSTVLASALQGAIYGAITGFTAIKVLRSPKVRK
jgi:ABC-type multidrug transport system permease subunit